MLQFWRAKQKIHGLGMKSSSRKFEQYPRGQQRGVVVWRQSRSEDLAVQGIDKFGTDNSFRERSWRFPTTES
jgi:hypothetical protein